MVNRLFPFLGWINKHLVFCYSIFQLGEREHVSVPAVGKYIMLFSFMIRKKSSYFFMAKPRLRIRAYLNHVESFSSHVTIGKITAKHFQFRYSVLAFSVCHLVFHNAFRANKKRQVRCRELFHNFSVELITVL